MGLPVTPPPQQPPVQQPPTEVVNVSKNQQDQNQDQFQDQFQQQDNRIGELLQNQRTESDADSSADSSSVNSAQQSNIQVNNTSNRIEYGQFKIPETTFTLSGYLNDGYDRGADYGVVAAINVPLGGKSRGKINKALEIKVSADKLAFEQEYSSVCANIEDGGFVVAKDAETLEMLSRCDSNIRKTKTIARKIPVAPKKPVVVDRSTEIDILKRENAELKAQLALILQKLDSNTTVPGGY